MFHLDEHIARLFSYGFRPLFLCSVGGALVYISWWIAILQSLLPAPNTTLTLTTWHAHEMVFGFVGAAIGGFLLTAVANWTKRPAVQGFELAGLVVCWLLARLLMAYNPGFSPLVVALFDSSYFGLLTVFMAREVVVARNTRNLKLVLILLVLTLLNFTFHFDQLFELAGAGELVLRATLVMICVLISVIGGRIIPAFTTNWLRQKHGADTPVPTPAGVFDAVVVGATVLFGFLWALVPFSSVTAGLALLAGILHLIRLSRWQPLRTWRDPLVLVLHTGYAWIGVGFMLLGTSIATGKFPASAGIHALGVGAMAGLILAVSSRAALGHTNRPLKADFILSAAFVMINVAALCRVGATVMGYGLSVAALFWLVAFVFFLIKFAPVLFGPVRPTESLNL